MIVNKSSLKIALPMISTLKRVLFLSILAISTVMLNGCIKGEFDTPPTTGVDPEIAASEIVSLKDVMAKYVPGAYTQIGLDKYLQGVVVADDKSGNFYKTLIVEDDNSDLGIALLIDQNELNALYPVGRRVFIKLRDLTISDYNGLPQIGMGVDNSGTSPRLGFIPSALVEDVILKGQYGLNVTPRLRTINTLAPDDINTLIKLEGVQFNVGTVATYADNNPTAPITVNQTLVDCDKNQVLVRNSGYADFAGLLMPTQNGSLTAVYSVFRTDKQLFIRDTSDVDFKNDRCGQTGGGNRIAVADVRNLFASGTTVAPAGFVQGVVISDGANGNTDTRNMVLQDGDAGVVLRFSAAHNVALGKEVKVNISDIGLSEFNGLLQVSTVPNDNIQIIGEGTVTPTILSISGINLSKHESTLITIKDVELSGGATYGSNSGNITMTDATGTITLYTRAAASFASQGLKTGKVTITAIVSEFNSPQLVLRKIEDVVGGGGGGTVDPPAGIDETFSSQSNNVDINISGWDNIAVKGTRKWQGKLFSGNTYAQATAFNDTNPEMEVWLISPEINTDSTDILTFETAKAFWVHDGLTVLVSSNYTGNPSAATWTTLSATIAKTTDADNTFIPSGDVNLKSFGQKVKVAFKYVGVGGTNTSTYRIDNVKVK